MGDYLTYLKDEIHSVVLATVDEQGCPVTCVIDMMLADKDGLYFLTAKGKALYERLTKNENISLTGFKGEDTMSSKSITIQAMVKEIGSALLERIFEQNPYMHDIYPNEESRKALTVFQIYKGNGEFFDLSVRPIFRECFSFGAADAIKTGYFVGENCIGCGTCQTVCPQNCIEIADGKATINPQHCLHCGRCLDVCPVNTIYKINSERRM